MTAVSDTLRFQWMSCETYRPTRSASTRSTGHLYGPSNVLILDGVSVMFIKYYKSSIKMKSYYMCSLNYAGRRRLNQQLCPACDDCSDPANALELRVVVRVVRLPIFLWWMVFQLLQRDLHGAFELRIMAFANKLGIEFDLNVGRDAMVLDFPFALGPENGPTWRSDGAAV